jgi:hypothetical protein
MAFAAGSYPEALVHYEQLVKKGYPDPYRAGFNLVLANVSAGRYAAAIQTGESLIREHPTAELFNLMARGYEGAGRAQQVRFSSLSHKIDPQDSGAISISSLCLTHGGSELGVRDRNAQRSAWVSVRLQRGQSA